MAASWYTFLALVTTALGASLAPSLRDGCGRVWVTIHSPEISQQGTTLLDAIELNWDFTGCLDPPKQIGLFRDRPTSWSESLVSYSLDSKDGYLLTNLSLGEPSLPGGWTTGQGTRGPQCLWPWIAAGHADIQLVNCLKIQPTWMEDNAEKLKGMRIGDLAIAGSHNAGSWRFNSELNQAARDRWVLCQDLSIWAQLVHGIRYFDFRVAYYDFYDSEEDRYWLNHNMIRVRPLVPLLREIKGFLDVTKETVFLDAHHFPIGFYDTSGAPIASVHAGLMALVMRELGDHVAPWRQFGSDPRGPTLHDLVSTNKRLLFSYADNSITSANDWLWPNLPHLWANTNDPVFLFDYLDDAIASSPAWNARSPLHSAMAQTTPTAVDILLMRGSLRINADIVNRVVSDRLRSTWKQRANIVSSDFFRGNDVIDIAIELCLERASGL